MWELFLASSQRAKVDFVHKVVTLFEFFIFYFASHEKNYADH
jgi:hypothetical protein